MAAPLLGRQSSAEDALHWPSPHQPPLGTELRNHASGRLHDICQAFDTEPSVDDCSRSSLVRLTYECSLSRESADYFLRCFFQAVNLPIDGVEPIDFEDVRVAFLDFADHLFDNFFLPVKASAKKTPQPSPASHSAAPEAEGQGGQQQYVGTESRLSVLRRDCLIRDRHRCVISRRFDFAETLKGSQSPGGPRDDDNNLLKNDPFEPNYLQVAHILPHSLTKTNKRGELDASKQSAIAILDMFDVGVADLIQGPGMDRPRNALTLGVLFHQAFGGFQVYFEPVPGREHT
ncbi:hypothetical protein F5Y17DRAFT_448941 [Xylariaceae sp. FL0594]|nr:hypothetical protein F5Y17DRAFT_448941 [Xylariaceae sp. FL0594]